MALQLIAAITLDKDYGISPVDSSYVSDLNNSSSNADVVTKATNSLLMNWIYNGFIDNIIISQHSINAVIDFEYGQNFRVEFDITTDQDIKVGIGYFKSGVYSFGFSPASSFPTLYPPSLLVSAGSTNVSVDNNSGTIDFDEVRIYYFLETTNNTNVTISNLEVSGLDADNGFDTGDRIIINWDDVAGDYLVQREDNPGATLVTITTGPELGFLERDQVTGVLFNRGPSGDKLEAAYGARSEYKFCDGLNLAEFFFKLDPYSFPYVFRFDTEDSPSCTPDNIVCDVQFDQSPIITPATNRFSNDGEVTLSATSSHADFVTPIKYTDEIPGTFQGLYNNIDPLDQSAFKTGLSYGQHTFYAVDQYNCWDVIQVNIPAQPSLEYGEKYRLQYNDIQTGVQSIVKIFERGYEGTVKDICGTGQPFDLVKTSGDINNKFDTVKPTECRFNAVTERGFQFIGLHSQDDRKYKVEFTHDDTLWYGFLTPSLWQEPYSPNSKYPVNITAIDNLGNLGDKDFVDDSGNVLTGTRTVIQLVSLILRKLDLNLNIVSAVNRFAEGMTITSADDPLLQTYINTDAFIDDQGNPYKCDVVLEALIKPFGAFIQQEDGKWKIIETDSQSQNYTYREFDPSGAYIGNGSISRPDIEIVSPTHVFGLPDQNALLANADQTLDIIPAYGKMSITQALKPVRSIFPTSLDKWTPVIFTGANANPYPIDGTRDKGVTFTNITSRNAALNSPFFKVKSRTDSVKINFDYSVILSPGTYFVDPVTGLTFNTLNTANPPYVKLYWRFICKVGGVDLYFSDRAGWTKITPIGTTVTSMSIPAGNANPSTRTFTTQTGLSISPGSLIKVRYTSDLLKFFRGVVSAYDNATGVLTMDTYSNQGTGTFADWEFFIGGSEYIDNYIYVTEFNDKFGSFDKEVVLPSFTSVTEVQLQLQIFVEGSKYIDFVDETTLKGIPTATNNVDYKVRGKDFTQPDYYLTWYNLRTGNDAEDVPDIIRGNDYNDNSNAVVWEHIENKFEFYRYVKDTQSINIQNVIVNFLPNKQNPIESETISFVNNSNFKENISVQISSGDLPTSIISDEIYTSIFRLQDGTPTKNWKRKLIAESSSLQSLLLKNIGNQYNKPTWRITGSLLIANAKFTSIIKQTIPGIEIDVLNEDFTGTLSPWENFGSGLAWTYSGNKANAINLGAGTDSTQYLRQAVGDLLAGTRIRVDFAFERAFVSGAGSKIDRAVCILWNGLNIVQKLTIYDGIESDGEYIRGVSFTIDQDATHISFGIENIVTDSDTIVDYYFDYFRVKGVSVVRYYYFNSYSRNDRHNLYGAELVQLIPMIASTNTDIDDTGGGNTGGDDDNGGNNGGAPFNGAFSSAWGGNFDTVLV